MQSFENQEKVSINQDILIMIRKLFSLLPNSFNQLSILADS